MCVFLTLCFFKLELCIGFYADNAAPCFDSCMRELTVRPLIYSSSWTLSFPLACFLSHFSCVRMTDGGQQNRVSGSLPPINGCGPLGQALAWTEINISPFKIYQKRIFESAAVACVHLHPPAAPPPPTVVQQTLNQTLCSNNQ